MKHEKILIIDFGGQYSQIIARRVRDCNVFADVLPCTKPVSLFMAEGYKGLIATGGTEVAFSKISDSYIRELSTLAIPMALVCPTDKLSDAFGDAAATVALDNDAIHSFLFDDCGCKGDWLMTDFINESVEKYKSELAGKKVLCALSGGVDSSVCAALLYKAIGDNLVCVFVDHGLMRKDEGAMVDKVFREQFKTNLIHIDAEQRFLDKLKGVTEPERKRKVIGEEFIRVFEDVSKEIGKVDCLCQGTIYPDIIESGVGDAKMVKSHHNVGGLPDVINFDSIIEPLKYLFKDEVRRVGVELGLPDELAYRQPFPGPGLGVRTLGELRKDKLDILREADAIFREEMAIAGLDKTTSQYFAVLTDVKSVGVTNDERTYAYTVALRAIITTDFMTAKCADIPFSVLQKTSKRITNAVPQINRVVYDITDKPPATVEWE